MDENTQEKLERYLELLGEIKKRVQNEQTAAILLSEIARDSRREQNYQKRIVISLGKNAFSIIHQFLR